MAQLVEIFFPNVTRYRYTPDLKSAMVRQTQQIIRKQRLQLTALALDFLTLGNAYLHPIYSRLGNLLALDAPRAKYMRRGLDLDTYYWVPLYGQEEAFTTPPWHLMQPCRVHSVHHRRQD